MATITDYFNIDSKHNITVNSETVITTNGGVEIPVRMFQNLAVGAYYFAIQIPKMDDAFDFCVGILSNNIVETVNNSLPKSIISSKRPTTQAVNTAELAFCGRIYIYSPNMLTEAEVAEIHKLGKKMGYHIEYYSDEWAEERSRMEKPKAFISHDSRDKKEIALPLALELSSIGVPVWYDEFSLRLGDSLRESIERGIKEASYCVLILTPNFLVNDGWTKEEFNSIFTKEIIMREKIILPVWSGISPKELYEYSPNLVDRMAADWSEGKSVVANKIKDVIES